MRFGLDRFYCTSNYKKNPPPKKTQPKMNIIVINFREKKSLQNQRFEVLFDDR